METSTIAEQLADFIVRTKYGDIAPEAIEYTKHLTLKTVAGMVAGATKATGRKMARSVRARELPAQAPVIGFDFATGIWESVFLNAYLAHAGELEDISFDSEGGTGRDITVIPLLLPIASSLGLSGRRLIEALVVGLEVTVRTGLYYILPHRIAMFPGALGAAAAAAKAYGLDKGQTIAALGHALSAAPQSAANFSRDAHFFESAMITLQGFLAAEAAKEDLNGNPDIHAFMAGICGEELAQKASPRVVANLGKDWMLRTIWLNKYPCSFVIHRQLDLLKDLMQKHDILHDAVDKIEVHVRSFEAFCDRPEPTSHNDLQFSYQHVLGSQLADGDLGLEHITQQAIADPRYVAARTKVQVIVHPDESSVAMAAPAKIVIRMKDGRVASGERLYPIGSDAQPLSRDGVIGLFHKYTKAVLNEKQRGKTVAAIVGMEDLEDPGEITMHTLVRQPVDVSNVLD